MKKLDEPIQIANGALSCPHCAGDVQVAAPVGLSPGCVIPTFACTACKKISGLRFKTGKKGCTAVEWFEIEPDKDIPSFCLYDEEELHPPAGFNKDLN